MLKTKGKRNLAMKALVAEMPEIKKILKEKGHDITKNWIAPQSIASLAMMKKLNEKGVSFDKVAEVFYNCLHAKAYITRKISKEEEEVIEINDYKTQLAAVKEFGNLMGISKGMSLPIPPSSMGDDKPSMVMVKFKDSKEKVAN